MIKPRQKRMLIIPTKSQQVKLADFHVSRLHEGAEGRYIDENDSEFRVQK